MDNLSLDQLDPVRQVKTRHFFCFKTKSVLCLKPRCGILSIGVSLFLMNR